MVRDKFIASQRSCDLRRHLDGAAPETSILDIVDSCRIWESHGEPADIEDITQAFPDDKQFGVRSRRSGAGDE